MKNKDMFQVEETSSKALDQNLVN